MEKNNIENFIEEFSKLKPKNKIDPDFVNNLRLKFVKKENNMFSFIFNKKFAFAFSGAALLLLAGVFTFALWPRQNNSALPLAAGVKIKDVGQNAFGKFVLANTNENANNQAMAPLNAARGAGGGASGDANGTSVIAPPYQIINYKYVYKGEDFSLPEGQVAVYKKVAGTTIADSLRNALGGLSLGFLDLGKFQNKKITSMEITEDKDSGYSIYLDGRGNTVSINLNWQNQPVGIYDEKAVSGESNIPTIADEKAVSIANNFLAKYGIDLKDYGAGEILKPAYKGFISDQATIVYPLQINGQDVYDQGGQKSGIYVMVSARTNQVSSVNGIELNNLESSKYDSEVPDKTRAIEIAENGGTFGNYKNPEGTKTVELDLGTPKLELVRFWIYDDRTPGGTELLIPSLIFPVINPQEQTMYYYQPNIVVPLVGSLAQDHGGLIRPMMEAK